MSDKVYSYEDCQPIIDKAWSKAIKYLEKKLGDQYTYNVTENAQVIFYDKVEQDIEYRMTCDRCGKVDIEGNFQEHQDYGNICYECYCEKCGD